MPYVSRAEREAERWMTWSALLNHVMGAEACGEPEARRQIQNAIDDRSLRYRWEHAWAAPYIARGVTTTGGPIYSYTPDYWLTCATDPADPDRVFEPPSYDRHLVDARTAKRFEKAREYRKPLFERECVIKIWPLQPSNVANAAKGVSAPPESSGGLGSHSPAEIHSLAGQLARELQRMFPDGRPAMKVDEIERALSKRPDIGKFGRRTLEKAIRKAWANDPQ